MNLPSVFEKYRAEIGVEMRSALAAYRSPLYDMLRYHLGWIDAQGRPLEGSAGKALRPTLCLLACEAAGGDYRRALPAAAALELIHNFSLIHDDIQDDDTERRHRPTVWSLGGKPQAINAGTAMKVVASLTLRRLAGHGIGIEKQARARLMLDESCLRLIEGQYLDIGFENRLDVTVADYLTMIEGKTGALIATSLQMGAVLATDDEATLQGFRDFGINVGLAFQIRDDVLGIWGDEVKTGKPVGSDIRRRKKSLPIVFALERAQGEERRALESLYEGADVDDEGVQRVLGLLEELHAREEVERRAAEYRDRALVGLEGLILSPWARDSLREMAGFLAEREF